MVMKWRPELSCESPKVSMTLTQRTPCHHDFCKKALMGQKFSSFSLHVFCTLFPQITMTSNSRSHCARYVLCMQVRAYVCTT